ncbi:MAG: hypothetical protein AB7P23_00730 [Amphiplicatus sp.]
MSPLRQVITAENPVATYRVSNPSRRIVEGRLSWTDLAPTETGYEAADAALREKMSAAPYLVVSPAYFRLEPGASKTITVRLRAAPPGLPCARGCERRSHLVFETNAARTPLRRAGGAGDLAADIGLALSTPVILRFGGARAAAAIAGTRLLRTPEGTLELETHVASHGDVSAYGRVDIMLKRTGEKTPILLKRLDNIAAYADAPARRVTAPLGVARLDPGVLEVRYIGEAEYAGLLLARRAFEVAPPD